MENNVDKITLLDEEGVETEFDVLTKLDIEDNEYVIVVPSDSEDSEDEAIALKIIKDEDGNDVLATIEDEEEFQMVAEAYEAVFQD
ncbi:DUF1292 domain-containing protein [Clostridium sp. 'White wine YQ']|uniref:DUF1292 domain-containing protein n=1 Tax=Clostridium sp. 'White wine YQ' TaxID=3027474 RepID=UPI002365D8AA|nr:DUF1292 domain-containing protein [Clostridium sp. 'White wine YQ']MDD7793325.1 DUF1292 domain-containing protein [Clostridium sp. 'White wine YQ']